MLIFSRLWHIIIVAKEIGEIPLDKTKTLRVAALRVFLFVTVNQSIQAVTAYSSLSSHLHM